VTLFHYRQTGNSTSYVLLGIQACWVGGGGDFQGRGGGASRPGAPGGVELGFEVESLSRLWGAGREPTARVCGLNTQPGAGAPHPALPCQVPPEAEADFKRAQRKLRQEFTFEEVEGRARDVFNMFIQ
jgi:hypothetical protein